MEKAKRDKLLTTDDITILNSVIEQISKHPQYHKNIIESVLQQSPFILNYHIHPGETTFCVSIVEIKTTRELAHIRGIGASEDLCRPLMMYFGRRLKTKFQLSFLPDIYLNGKLYLKDEPVK